MARRRMVWPNFWPSRHWVRLQPFRIRLLFLGICSNADDEGRIIGLAPSIRAAVFPHDKVTDEVIEADLEALAREGLINRYQCEGVPYIQVAKWKKYQKIDHPQPSHIPAIEQGELFVAVNSDGDYLGDDHDTNGNDHNSLNDSGNSSVNDSGNDSKNGSKNDSGVDQGSVVKASLSKKSANLPDGAYRTFKKRILKGPHLTAFMAFWDAFDHKHDKSRAADAWLDIAWPDDKTGKNALFSQIIKAAKKAAVDRKYTQQQGGTPPYAEKWITHRRWEDDN